MAATKVNARSWTVEISDGAAIPVFTEIGGLKSISFENSEAETDTTDFASDGDAEHDVMERGRTYTLEGFFLEDVADGTRDAGQEAVETLAAAVGAASHQDFRVTSPGGTTETFDATARLGSKGGGNNDKTSWSVTLKRSGSSTVA